MIEPVLNLLSADAALIALVSDRFFTSRLPQGTELPAVLLRTVTGEYGHNLSGGDGTTRHRIEVSCISLNYRQTMTLAELVRQVVQGYLGGSIDSILFESIADVTEPVGDGSDNLIYRRVIDLSVSGQL